MTTAHDLARINRLRSMPRGLSAPTPHANPIVLDPKSAQEKLEHRIANELNASSRGLHNNRNRKNR